MIRAALPDPDRRKRWLDDLCATVSPRPDELLRGPLETGLGLREWPEDPPLGAHLVGFQVERIDVVRLMDRNDLGDTAEFTIGPFQFYASEPVALDENQRAECWRLACALPRGKMARCHYPGFGLQLGLADGTSAKVSLCFQCHNAYLGDELTSFDAGSEEGSALLTFLREIVPFGRPSP